MHAHGLLHKPDELGQAFHLLFESSRVVGRQRLERIHEVAAVAEECASSAQCVSSQRPPIFTYTRTTQQNEQRYHAMVAEEIALLHSPPPLFPESLASTFVWVWPQWI